MLSEVAWPSGLRRWFKAPVSSGAWVRIPPLPAGFFFCFRFSQNYTMTYLHSFYTFEQGGYFLKKLWYCVGGDVKHKILDLSTELIR